jgi:hypothetical protein
MAKKLKIWNGASWEDVTFAITPPTTNVTNSFSTNQVIDASTSVAALRITQRGTGESFRVEDETNPDSTPFIINAAGNVAIGSASPQAMLHLERNSSGEIGAFIWNTNASGYAALRIGNSDRGTNGDHLIYGSSALGLRSKTGAAITFEPSGTERMRLTTAGNLAIGMNDPVFRLQTYNENTSATVGSQALVFQAQIAGGNNDYLKLYSERTLTGGASWSTQDWILRRHVDATPMGGIKWGAGEWNPTAFYGAPLSQSIRTTYISTGTPSGGIDGDMWATYV